MKKLTAILVLIASFLMVAPVLESGTQSRVPVFQAVGNACDGGGGRLVGPGSRQSLGSIEPPTHSAPQGAAEAMMAKVWAVVAIVVSFLVVAPVIESGTQSRAPSSRRWATPATAAAGAGSGRRPQDASGRGPRRPAPAWRRLGLVLGALWLSLGLGPGIGRGPGAHGSAAGRSIVGPSATIRRPWTRRGSGTSTASPSVQQLFDGLVQFDHTLSITPALAQFWVASRDGLIWTFTLRKGVKFHHGREVTADDVVYSFTRLVDPRAPLGRAPTSSWASGARQEFREGRAKQVDAAWPRSTATPSA